ncbi:hypothetical protein [Nonomuraea sp. NPDC049695]|uniref:hypothetical protein n=1 Tax=Nonomuraea sp. NPDC049695 TaxID=3154734 RepID=UPI003436D4DC
MSGAAVPDPEEALRAMPLHELRDAVSRITVARLLPQLLALPDDVLRDVLCEVLAERAPYGHTPYREARLLLAVPGPTPERPASKDPASKNGAPGWRHRAVGIALPHLGERKKRGRLAFEGRCAVCAAALCADTAQVACPVCGMTEKVSRG